MIVRTVTNFFGWTNPRALQDPRPARRGRDGRRLPRPGHEARPAGRAQGPADRQHRRAKKRSSGSGAKRAPRRRSIIRTSARSTASTSTRASCISRWSCSTASRSIAGLSGRPLDLKHAARHRHAGRRRARRRAHRRHPASRHQAGQHLPDAPRPGEGARLRPREAVAGVPPLGPASRRAHDDARSPNISRAWPAPRSAPSPTCRRSRRAATTSIRAPTCSRSAWCSTRWRPAAQSFPGTHHRGRLRRHPQSRPDAAEHDQRDAARRSSIASSRRRSRRIAALRYQTAADLGADLQAAAARLGHRAHVAIAPRGIERRGRRDRRRRWSIAVRAPTTHDRRGRPAIGRRRRPAAPTAGAAGRRAMPPRCCRQRRRRRRGCWGAGVGVVAVAAIAAGRRRVLRRIAAASRAGRSADRPRLPTPRAGADAAPPPAAAPTGRPRADAAPPPAPTPSRAGAGDAGRRRAGRDAGRRRRRERPRPPAPSPARSHRCRRTAPPPAPASARRRRRRSGSKSRKAKLASNLIDQALADLRQIIIDFPARATAAEAAFLAARDSREDRPRRRCDGGVRGIRQPLRQRSRASPTPSCAARADRSVAAQPNATGAAR